MLTSACRPDFKISLMSKKKGGDDFDGAHNGQIFRNPIYCNCRIRMSIESLIYKSMNSCDSKGSTLRAALQNPVINSNKFSCLSCILVHNNVPFELAGNKAAWPLARGKQAQRAAEVLRVSP